MERNAEQNTWTEILGVEGRSRVGFCFGYFKLVLAVRNLHGVEERGVG